LLSVRKFALSLRNSKGAFLAGHLPSIHLCSYIGRCCKKDIDKITRRPPSGKSRSLSWLDTAEPLESVLALTTRILCLTFSNPLVQSCAGLGNALLLLLSAARQNKYPHTGHHLN